MRGRADNSKAGLGTWESMKRDVVNMAQSLSPGLHPRTRCTKHNALPP